MASLRDAAREIIEAAREGVAWHIIWKEGRGWKSLNIWPEDVDYNAHVVEFDAPTVNRAEIERILDTDSGAQFVNSYYYNLGIGCEDDGESYGSVADLCRGIRYMVDNDAANFSGWTILWKNSDAPEDLRLSDDEVRAADRFMSTEDPLWLPAHYPRRLTNENLLDLCRDLGSTYNNPLRAELCRRAGMEAEYRAAETIVKASKVWRAAVINLRLIPLLPAT